MGRNASPNAKVSQAFLASLPELQDERGRPLAWTLVADGHHGRYFSDGPRNCLGKRNGPCELGLPWPDALRRELLAELVRLFGRLPSDRVEIGARLHWLTGFVTFCDWIGSNTDWFPLSDETELRDRVSPGDARDGAETVLDLIGWHRRETQPDLRFARLFATHLEPEGFEPRPLQEALVELADAPGLYIVEAPMGSGKTEAALAAAYRRWSVGGERGLYFALPTQLTSNRIHDRIADFLVNVVADSSIQTLVHGSAWLREDRAIAFDPAPTAERRKKDDPSDATDACRWFASSRKALLAPFGTGTVDQALMARISAKHSALRLFALSGKVVVLDEIHSYDPYTSKLVDHLVQWLLEVGCTVVVLSATLSARRRREMIETVGAREPDPAPTDYPLITKVADNVVTQVPIADPSIRESRVRLSHLSDGDPAILGRIADAAESGACVLVIRNTVALAQKTYREIKSACRDTGIEFGLLHSRFPHFQRDANERLWMDRLGKRDSQRPGGCLLVATQVVEQSVDIDADLLVTDLAPTDLLLQRLGRLHRHERTRPSGFETPACWILHPDVDWDADPKAIKEALGPSAFIYPPIALFQAGRIWRDRELVILPSGIRELLEAADAIPDELPEGARHFRDELQKLARDMGLVAGRQDPFRQVATQDTEGAQTRWRSMPSAHLVMLREPPVQRGGEIAIDLLGAGQRRFFVGRFDYDLAKALHENTTRIPAYLVRDAFASQPAWLAQHISDAALTILPPGSDTLEIAGLEDPAYQLRYRPDIGVSHERITERVSRRYDGEDADDWY